MKIIRRKKRKALWTAAFPKQVQRSRSKDQQRIRKIDYRAAACEYVRSAIKRGETCAVVAAIPELRNGRRYGHKISARLSEVHHTRGRLGELLTDKRYWMPVSKAGHRFIHANISEARKRGWVCPIGQWNVPDPLPGPEVCLDTAAERIRRTLRQEEEQKCDHCRKPGIYIRTRYFADGEADVWMCQTKACQSFSLYWHVDKPTTKANEPHRTKAKPKQ